MGPRSVEARNVGHEHGVDRSCCSGLRSFDFCLGLSSIQLLQACGWVGGLLEGLCVFVFDFWPWIGQHTAVASVRLGGGPATRFAYTCMWVLFVEEGGRRVFDVCLCL